MNILQLFSHSDELHNATTSSLEHTLTQPAVAVPLFVIANYLLFLGLAKHKKQAVMPALLGVNLIAGVASYELVPVVSILAITTGIIAALAITLSLLSGN